MFNVSKHSKYSYVTIVRIPFDDIDKIDFALCAQPTETPDKYYKRQAIKPDIITNGGFFTMSNGVTCFGFRDEGDSVAISSYLGVGITGDKTLSYGRNQSQASALRDFISAYPPLVEYGKKYSASYAKEIDYNARRTCIGWNDTNYFVVTVDAPGLRFSVLSDIFIELGATFAINLDGGGSTRLLIDGTRRTAVSYARPVDNVMCVYLKKQEVPTTTIYRVQVGAFKNKSNADNLLATLKSKGFSDAYIKNIDGYYKVQVGAYSVKLNADRMMDRIKALDYKPFISTK